MNCAAQWPHSSTGTWKPLIAETAEDKTEQGDRMTLSHLTHRPRLVSSREHRLSRHLRQLKQSPEEERRAGREDHTAAAISVAY